MREQARKAARDADHVTDAMRDDVMQLLDMFGIPYIVSVHVVMLLTRVLLLSVSRF